MGARKWSDNERDTALDIYQSDGLAAAWRATGIPKPTIVGWAADEGIERSGTEQTRAATEVHQADAQELRARLKLMLLEKAVDVLERMDAPHVDFKGKDSDKVTYPIAPAAAVQNYATSAAILIDKYRLEVGEVTARSEFGNIAHNDHEADALKRAIDDYLATGDVLPGEAASDPQAVAVEGAGA